MNEIVFQHISLSFMENFFRVVSARGVFLFVTAVIDWYSLNPAVPVVFYWSLIFLLVFFFFCLYKLIGDRLGDLLVG